MRLLAWVAAAAATFGLAAEPAPERYPVRGIDVSHHQGAIDWTKVAKSGVAFAYLKASEGATWRDRRFAENWRGAERAGLARGAYHYFSFCSRGAKQAANFLAAVPPTKGVLPPVADVEFVGNCERWKSLEEVRAELRAFLAEVEKAWRVRPILYVTSESHERITRGHFDGYPLWIRSVQGPPAADLDPAWIFWQYSETGKVPGIAGPVDLNVFSGSAEELGEIARRESRARLGAG